MSLYYPTPGVGCGSGGTVPDYSCNPCPAYEFGRIGSVALIKNSFSFTDPTSTAQWTAGIATKDIVVIWKTLGSYDGGVTAELPGYGRSVSENGNTTHTLNFKDPNYAENWDFYSGIKASSEYTLAFCTSSQVHFAGAPVTFTPKNPIAEDINSVVNWDVQCKWANNAMPRPYNQPSGIFDRCYIVA